MKVDIPSNKKDDHVLHLWIFFFIKTMNYWLVGWLFYRVSTHFRSLNADSFLTNQFSISIVFVYKQLNIKTLLIQAIQFSISAQFSSIWPYQVQPLQAKVDLGVMAMKGYPASPKLLHYWNLTIRLFNVISRTLIEGKVLPLCREVVGIFYSLSQLGNMNYYYERCRV